MKEQQVIEKEFWKHVGNAEQKGMTYNHLKISGKTGFYKDGVLVGYVERVLSDERYFILTND